MIRISPFLCPLFIIFLGACSDVETTSTEEVQKTSVEVIRVCEKPREEVINLLGTVEANREMKVSFKLGGKIKRLAFEEGQLIEEGALLAELDTAELSAQRERALAKRNKAKRDLDRTRRLFDKHTVPLASLQDARSLFISAEAELKIVEDGLENSIIKASFTGRIIRKLSEVGEVVGPGTPVAILAEIDPILVKAAVPDNLTQKIGIGDVAYVRVDCYPQKTFEGTINRLETTADPLSRTLGAEVRLANPDEELKPGLIAHVEVIHREEGLRILVPLNAVIAFGSNPAVFVIENLKAERRAIAIGDIIGEEVEVLEGLSPLEMVVVNGQAYLNDGQQVLIDRNEVETR